MNNQLQIFTNEQFGQVRTLVRDGEPWFVGKDVAEALGYANTRDAIATHVDEAEKAAVAIHDGSQNRSQTIINESGLYSLIFGSKLEAAKSFKRWVTSEVLPSIHKHGEYITPKKAQQRLGEVNSAARIIRQTLKEAGMAPEFVAVAMKSLYAPVGVEIPREGITLNKRLYDATAIAERFGIYSEKGNPHTRAVSAIIAKAGVLPEEKELAPFQNAKSGHAGASYQYTESVVTKAGLWLEKNGFPGKFQHNGKNYTVTYRRGVA